MKTPKTDTAWFTFRTAGVILHGGYILLQHDTGTWFLPGGRVELLELAQTALERELYEELGITVTVERLLWVFEGFAPQWGKIRHELGMYFLVYLPPDPLRDNKAAPIVRPEQHYTLHFQWIPLANLDELALYPPFLARKLSHLSEGIEHLVYRQDGSE